MTLATYRAKRDFKKTPEPKGAAAKRQGWRYVVQKHDASRLHYDFRLELDGVLKSWAVPKGPSLDRADKRLAMQVEDHPIQYALFEGVIPEGEYGGGTVMVWDRGRWIPEEDPHEGLRSGKLKFRLEGEKLRGSWALVRRGGRSNRGENAWLLIKHRDERSSQGDPPIVDSQPLSVASGRDLDAIAAAKDRVWKDGRAVSVTPQQNVKPPGRKARSRKPPRRGAAAELPRFIEPQLATLTDAAPPGDAWWHEIKLDGYRMGCRIEKGRAEFISRNGQSWTDRFPHLVAAARQLPVRAA